MKREGRIEFEFASEFESEGPDVKIERMLNKKVNSHLPEAPEAILTRRRRHTFQGVSFTISSLGLSAFFGFLICHNLFCDWNISLRTGSWGLNKYMHTWLIRSVCLSVSSVLPPSSSSFLAELAGFMFCIAGRGKHFQRATFCVCWPFFVNVVYGKSLIDNWPERFPVLSFFILILFLFLFPFLPSVSTVLSVHSCDTFQVSAWQFKIHPSSWILKNSIHASGFDQWWMEQGENGI